MWKINNENEFAMYISRSHTQSRRYEDGCFRYDLICEDIVTVMLNKFTAWKYIFLVSLHQPQGYEAKQNW